MAIQFAKYIGAHILTTASPANYDYVKKLGAHEAFDYNQGFTAEIKKLFPHGIDVLFDCAGGKSLRDSLSLLKPQGRLVNIVEQLGAAEAAKYNIQSSYVFVNPNGKQLAEIGKLIAEDKIVVPHIQEMPLKDAAKAQEKSRSGHQQGKIVLKVK